MFVTDITNKDELNEIEKIGNMLKPNERVLLVARQSRFLPGGSALTPNIANSTAIASPIPLLDPVMTALFVFNSIMV